MQSQWLNITDREFNLLEANTPSIQREKFAVTAQGFQMKSKMPAYIIGRPKQQKFTPRSMVQKHTLHIHNMKFNHEVIQVLCKIRRRKNERAPS